jgi:rhamnosyl/mannosyltransferase
VPEALTHDVTGLLHAHQDAVGLAGAIARLLDDPSLASRLGAAARHDADHRFGQARFARDVYALYQRVSGKTSKDNEARGVMGQG